MGMLHIQKLKRLTIDLDFTYFGDSIKMVTSLLSALGNLQKLRFTGITTVEQFFIIEAFNETKSLKKVKIDLSQVQKFDANAGLQLLSSLEYVLHWTFEINRQTMFMRYMQEFIYYWERSKYCSIYLKVKGEQNLKENVKPLFHTEHGKIKLAHILIPSMDMCIKNLRHLDLKFCTFQNSKFNMPSLKTISLRHVTFKNSLSLETPLITAIEIYSPIHLQKVKVTSESMFLRKVYVEKTQDGKDVEVVRTDSSQLTWIHYYGVEYPHKFSQYLKILRIPEDWMDNIASSMDTFCHQNQQVKEIYLMDLKNDEELAEKVLEFPMKLKKLVMFGIEKAQRKVIDILFEKIKFYDNLRVLKFGTLETQQIVEQKIKEEKELDELFTLPKHLIIL